MRPPPSISKHTSIYDAIRALVVGMIAIYALLFVASRIHILHESYAHLSQVRSDEEWLATSCKNPEFYSNLKSHSSLCDEVAEKHRSVMFLMALEKVIDKTHLCGYSDCSTLLSHLADWVLGRGAILCAFLLILFALLPVCVFPIWRNFINARADLRMKRMYNAPFGSIHYNQTDPYETLLLQTSPIEPLQHDQHARHPYNQQIAEF